MYKLKATWTETFIALAMVTSVFTQLRFASAVGISEIILLCVGIFGKFEKTHILKEYHSNQDLYVKVIAIITPIGMAAHAVVMAVACPGREMFDISGVMHDVFAFVFVAFIVYRIFNRWNLYDRILEVLSKFFLFELLVNFLYMGMYFTGNGFYMEERFTGFAEDPNQLTEVFFLIPWIGMYYIFKLKEKKPKKYLLHIAICLACIATTVYIGFLTESDTFVLSFYLSIIAFAIFEVVNIFTGKSKNWMFFFVVLAAAVWIVFNFDVVWDLVDDYVVTTAEDTNQLSTRQAVWLHGLQAFLYSPIVGNGPGVYSGRWGAFGGAESHNTYIYILMDYGIVGFIVFMKMLSGVLKKVWISHSPFILAGLVCFLIFNFFHSCHRMPLFWFYIYLFMAIGIHEWKKFADDDNLINGENNENAVYT